MSIVSLHGLARAEFADSVSTANRDHSRPQIGRGVVFGLHEALMGRDTQKIARNLIKWQFIGAEERRTRQLIQLWKLIKHAVQNCPYYASPIYAAAAGENSIDNLCSLPLVSRSALRNHAREMCRRDDSAKLLHDHTRGSTDEKLIYFWDRTRQAWDKANRIRGHSWHGFAQGHRELHLWPVDPPVDLNGRIRLAARRFRDEMLSELQIDSLQLENIKPVDFWNSVRRFGPSRITAFPSALTAMIQRDEVVARNSRIPSLRVVFLTGEVTYQWQRLLIGQTLRVPCIESYGVQEAGAIAYECPSRSWHMCAESMIVEFISEGRPARPGELAEVVVTPLQSYAMPLIRYRTGDVVRVNNETCGCGLTLPVMPRLLGRVSDFLVTDRGQLLEPADVIETLSQLFGAGEFQVSQNPNGSVIISVIESGKLRDELVPRLASALRGFFGHRVSFTIQVVSKLARTEFGKCRYVNSKVPTGLT